jgi:hypothetical protein
MSSGLAQLCPAFQGALPFTSDTWGQEAKATEADAFQVRGASAGGIAADTAAAAARRKPQQQPRSAVLAGRPPRQDAASHFVYCVSLCFVNVLFMFMFRLCVVYGSLMFRLCFIYVVFMFRL